MSASHGNLCISLMFLSVRYLCSLLDSHIFLREQTGVCLLFWIRVMSITSGTVHNDMTLLSFPLNSALVERSPESFYYAKAFLFVVDCEY
jgi:hypothetical protein